MKPVEHDYARQQMYFRGTKFLATYPEYQKCVYKLACQQNNKLLISLSMFGKIDLIIKIHDNSGIVDLSSGIPSERKFLSTVLTDTRQYNLVTSNKYNFPKDLLRSVTRHL